MKNNVNPQRKNTGVILDDVSPWKKVETFILNLYDLQYNEVSNEVEYKSKDDADFQPLNENNLYREIQHRQLKFSLQNLISLLKSDFVPKVNPFKQYFASLPKWKEGGQDHISNLANCVHTKDQNGFIKHFKKMLVRCVACALEDQYYNKTAFILVGEKQHTGKSTFIRFLCPSALEKYISETINFSDKDSHIALCDNFIINIDELAILNKADLNSLKSFLSKDRTKIRHPFDRKPKSTPRRASFFGSTNDAEFLSDATGSVRWICFELASIEHPIDYEAYNKNIKIDLVWAQAYSLLKSDFDKDLTKEEIVANETRNQSFQYSTPELELIQKAYEPSTKDKDGLFMTATDIFSDLCVDNSWIKTRCNNVAIGKALKILGFKREQSIKPGAKMPTKGYYVKSLR